MTSPLERLAGPGKSLLAEPFDQAEFEGLVRAARARLTDARRGSNSLESRFDLAYNAAHGVCLAALRLSGFRATNRYIVFQVLPHTLGLAPQRIPERICGDVTGDAERRSCHNCITVVM